MAEIPDPPFAHVPGQNARHAEGAFDRLRATVPPDMPRGAVFASQAWLAGLQFLERGYFWEAHEVWEAVWLVLPEGSGERRLVRGMIQLANAELKRKMGRSNAVRRLCGLAGEEFRGLPPALWTGAGLGEAQIRHRLEELAGNAALDANNAI